MSVVPFQSEKNQSEKSSESEETAFYQAAFARNIGLLSLSEQERLREATVAIAGVGGVGGIHATTLARLGIVGFHIADMDIFEVANINRQVGAGVATLGQEKVRVMEQQLRAIHPFASVKTFPQGITEANIDAFLDGVDVVLDGLDFFELDIRRLLFSKASAKGLYVVTAGPIGYGSAILVFDPKGMSFDEYFDIQDGMSSEQMALRFGLGSTPALLQRAYFRPEKVDFKNRKAPSLVIGTLLAANLVSTQVVKILLGKPLCTIPRSAHFDPFAERYRKVHLRWGNRGWFQRLKIWIVNRTLEAQRK